MCFASEIFTAVLCHTGTPISLHHNCYSCTTPRWTASSCQHNLYPRIVLILSAGDKEKCSPWNLGLEKQFSNLFVVTVQTDVFWTVTPWELVGISALVARKVEVIFSSEAHGVTCLQALQHSRPQQTAGASHQANWRLMKFAYICRSVLCVGGPVGETLCPHAPKGPVRCSGDLPRHSYDVGRL